MGKKLGRNMDIFYGIMGGMSLLLFFNGVINFVHTMYSSIQERSHEFKVLGSIGMTDTQVHVMPLYEGLVYAGVILTLVILISCMGSGILFKGIAGIAPYAEYHFPVIELMSVIAAVCLVCGSIPGFSYKRLYTGNGQREQIKS